MTDGSRTHDTAGAARQIHAALANPQTRELWAQVILGQAPDAPNARQRRGLEQLEQAGLIRWDVAEDSGEDGVVRPVPTGVFKELLAAGREPAAIGYERFLEKGRVVRWPSKAADKHGLILWIMGQCLEAGEKLGEKELNQRIQRFTDDPALVRRYCVDLGEVNRTPDGAAYARPGI